MTNGSTDNISSLKWKYNNVMLVLRYKWKLRLQLSVEILNVYCVCSCMFDVVNS